MVKKDKKDTVSLLQKKRAQTDKKFNKMRKGFRQRIEDEGPVSMSNSRFLRHEKFTEDESLMIDIKAHEQEKNPHRKSISKSIVMDKVDKMVSDSKKKKKKP